MENLIVLDTCILLDFLVGKVNKDISQVKGLLIDAKVAVSVVTVYELLRGVESESHIEQRMKLIGLCTKLDLTPQISVRAAGIYTYLKKNGSLIHTEDIYIAATALHWRYSIMTSNLKDFSRIPGVLLEE
jgi:predicted nucleic acid-binding protein